MSAFNKIAIYGSRTQDAYLDELSGFFAFLEEAGFRTVMADRFATYLEEKKVNTHGAVPVKNLPSDSNLVVSIGGDGTFLRAARWIGEREVPVFGINTGHLGFLSSCSLSESAGMIRAICRGEVEIERRMMLTVECDALPRDIWPYALNEVAVLRNETTSIISVEAQVDGNFLADYRADGLIVATPTGSTAYSLSAGGPIIQPTLNCMALSPIAPHTLTLRPLVLGGDSEILLKARGRSKSFRLSLDDRSFQIPAETTIRITRAPFPVLVIRKQGINFASILRDKLLWNA